MKPKNISQAAQDALKRSAADPKRLALIHTGATLLFSLLITLGNFLLTRSMESATGLAQLGSRALLGTVQSVLSLVSTVAIPFWQVGFLYAVLQNLRTQNTGAPDLLEGFRRFGVVARLYILLFGIIMLLLVLSAQVASAIISFTPFWRNMMLEANEILENAITAGQSTLSSEELASLMPVVLPTVIVAGLLLAAVGIPLFYRFRLAFFAIMDEATGARHALKISSQLTRGYKMSLFRLDLHFWWYYAAMVLFALIAYGDMLLPALGITLPVSADGLFFISYGIYILLQLVFSRQFATYVQTSYALFYNNRKQDFTAEQPPQLPQTENTPY